ncbi:MAG: NUDIX domain-containing protein [Clostridiales bacterium]|nr:NUDIX domain-containing protein [Clostridiales bacterium]
MDGRLRNMTAVYISRGEEMLLLYRVGSRVVPPSYCGVGGHFERDELNDARACALRELYEETGLREADLIGFRMRYGCMRLKNGEIRQNYYFFAELAPQAALPDGCAEGRLEWVKYGDLLKKEMPHTAYYVIKHYLETGRYTDCLYAGAATQDGLTFTALTEF